MSDDVQREAARRLLFLGVAVEIAALAVLGAMQWLHAPRWDFAIIAVIGGAVAVCLAVLVRVYRSLR